MFNDAEKALILSLAEKINGARQEAVSEDGMAKISQRIAMNGKRDLVDYLRFANGEPREWSYLASALTVRSNTWFREKQHYLRLQNFLASWDIADGQPLRVLAASCSTGEEVYSLALVLEAHRTKHPDFTYTVEGWDIDPIALGKGRAVRFPLAGLEHIPKEYHRFTVPLDDGANFSLQREVVKRCSFRVVNLQRLLAYVPTVYHFITHAESAGLLVGELQQVVSNLSDSLAVNGWLCLDHPEDLDADAYGLCLIGPVYGKAKVNKAKIGRILMVGDSPAMRKAMQQMFEPTAIGVDAVPSAVAAAEAFDGQAYDLIVLDLGQQGASGKVWLRQQRRRGLDTPVVFITGPSLQELVVTEALGGGAADFIDKAAFTETPAQVLKQFTVLVEASVERRGTPGVVKTRGLVEGKSQRSYILLVEDEPMQLALMSEMLHQAGFPNLTASDGFAALAIAKQEPISLVISDYQMPGMHGVELCKALKHQHNNLPCVLISGFADKELAWSAMGVAIDDILVKPFAGKELECLAKIFGAEPNPMIKSTAPQLYHPKVILIGASSGTDALYRLLKEMPKPSPPVVVVRPMIRAFAAPFAAHLAALSGLTLGSMESGAVLADDHLYVSSGAAAIGVLRLDGGALAFKQEADAAKPNAEVGGPVDYMFHAAAMVHELKGLACLLSGVGRDGAQGLAMLHSAGNITAAQNRASSVVFGLTKAAIDLGAADLVGDLEDIRALIASALMVAK